MDFDLTEEQAAVRALAAQVFTDRATPERVRAVEQGLAAEQGSAGGQGPVGGQGGAGGQGPVGGAADRTDGALWRELAATGLLALPLPEEHGGAGLGLLELCALFREQGRATAPVPLWSALLAALALSAHGSPAQRDAHLPGAADGSSRLALALEEFGPAVAESPATRARHADAGTTLTGVKAAVPGLAGAASVVVSATDAADGRAGLYLVDPQCDGCTTEPAETTDHHLAGHLTLDEAPAVPLGGPAALPHLLDRARTALAALQAGVAEAALAQAVRHLAVREQFGRPLGAFQAVAHQVADCYIDLEAMRVTLWQAAWLLDTGGEVGTAVEVAKWWADDAGQRVVHRVVHLHGGLGVDIEYPVHRNLLWGKQLAGTLGSPAADLDRLGALLAAGTGEAATPPAPEPPRTEAAR
ncbi:acyl-CoA dehydrogenase family protein [Streptomyces xiaopingdaonensis]|uniref:acyl-CoA dehydrogenase family protein n=1 Tax=Streptomyces xiaopingdaonensis TaxID=1565415 RepID=UPI0002F06EDE|nr:acyl-CoA dehydrogenase family protein [Streptomyces xiaopingdaonensis]